MTTEVVTSDSVDHPARFSESVLVALSHLLNARLTSDASVLDPFAGVGGIHAFPYTTVGVEIEPEWAAAHRQTICGDSTNLVDLFPAYQFDAVVTSPAYGNRMADNYAGDAKGTRRFTYRIALGRPLSDGSAAGMQWGDRYREVHERVWRQCWDVLRPGGLMVVNVSNHIRAGQEQRVAEWHLVTLLDIGFGLDEVLAVRTPRVGFGANAQSRVATEKVIALRKP